MKDFLRDADRGQLGTTANRLPELKDWRRRLQRGVDRLRDHFCRQHVLELIYYSDDAEFQLSPETYLHLDHDGGDPNWHQEPMPSSIFQVGAVTLFLLFLLSSVPNLPILPVLRRCHSAHILILRVVILQSLFNKLTSMQQTASEVLAGRDRVVIVLLMRLTETLVIWLSEDQEFWDAIEEGDTRLGPIGLQQVCFLFQVVHLNMFLVEAHVGYATDIWSIICVRF